MDLSPAPRPAIALLVDAENLSATLAPALLAAIRSCGEPQVRRAYGHAGAVSGWGDLGFRLCPTRPGKNAADLLLCVEAMALALQGGFDTLVIASSDRDFTYLAEHLREAGKRVIGAGKATAPQGFRAACTRFVVLEPARSPAPALPPAKGAGKATTSGAGTAGTLLEQVRKAVAAAGPGGLPMASLNPVLRGLGGVRISETPEGSWRKWLKARGTLFDCDAKGPQARVRLRG
jgi:hypothetical protein